MTFKILIAERNPEDMTQIVKAVETDQSFEIVGKATTGNEIISNVNYIKCNLIILSTSVIDLELEI